MKAITEPLPTARLNPQPLSGRQVLLIRAGVILLAWSAAVALVLVSS